MATFFIDTATSGNNTIIAGLPGKLIRLTSLVLVVAGAVTVQWLSGSAATELSGAMSLITGVPYSLSFSPAGMHGNRVNYYLSTVLAGDALILAIGGAVQVSGHGTFYYEVV